MERAPQLGDLLVSVGLISKQQLAAALLYQKEHGVMLGQALVRIGACSDADITGALEAQKTNTPLGQRLAVIKGRETHAPAQPAAMPPEATWHYIQLFERELRRIARDVQDVSQLLGEMGLETEVARKTLATNPQAAEQTLADMWERLKVIATELDYYAFELAPHALDEGNLLVVLKQYVGHYHRCYQGNLELGLRTGDLRTSPQTATGLFRALQCLLRGVGNSEGSHDAEVFLSIEGQDVVAEVAFQRIQPGLNSAGDPIGEMDERLRLIGGRSERREDGDHIVVVCRAPVGPLPPAQRAAVIT